MVYPIHFRFSNTPIGRLATLGVRKLNWQAAAPTAWSIRMISRAVSIRVATPLLLCLLLHVWGLGGLAFATRAEDEQRIDGLIERLGSNEYAQREKARAELLASGMDAFDALQRAQAHADVEVRKQAEYLVQILRISGFTEDDPPEVRQILRDYRHESLEERESRLRRLAQLQNIASLRALCRLVRFEDSEILSKRGALLVMNLPLPDNRDQIEEYQHVVENSIGQSERTGAVWLRTYLAHLEDPLGTANRWMHLADWEAESMAQRPDKMRVLLLRDLLRWQVDAFDEMGLREQALATMQRTLELQNASRSELLETLDWLIARSAWDLIDHLTQQFQSTIHQDPYLLYRLAEAFNLQDRQDEAEKLATKARGIDLPSEPLAHVELGWRLQSRGLISWAEAEYRRAVELSPPDSHAHLQAGIQLGAMMHDQGRHLEAYEALKQIVDLFQDNPIAERRVAELNRDPDAIRGQMHFSLALVHQQRGEIGEQIAALDQAVTHDPTNADILIAMYRTEQAEEAWKDQVRTRIVQTAEKFRSQLFRADRNFQASASSEAKRELAFRLNQYAWLVANTVGDYQTALDYSRRSLELLPEDAGYLDTLARCYFAVGNLDQAIQTQRRAVDLEPHSGQIQRQLEFFEQTEKPQPVGS